MLANEQVTVPAVKLNCRDHEQHGSGKLHRHESIAPQESFAALALFARLERWRHVGPGCLKRRNQSEQNRTGYGNEKCEVQHTGIDSERQLNWSVTNGHGRRGEEIQCRLRDPKSHDRSCEGDDKTFDHKLPHQSRAARADGEPHRYFTRARLSSSEHQVGNVAASDQKDDQNQSEQRYDHHAINRHPLESELALSEYRGAKTAIGVGIRLFERLCQRRRLSRPRFNRYAGFQAPFDIESSQRTVVENIGIRRKLARHHDGCVEDGMDERIEARERLRRDSDDVEIDTAELHPPADDRRIRRELAFPEAMIQDDHCISAGDAILVGTEFAAELQLDPKHFEEISTDDVAHAELRLSSCVGRKTRWNEVVCKQIFERLVVLFEVHEVRIREPATEIRQA